jgi:hypothetical protein
MVKQRPMAVEFLPDIDGIKINEVLLLSTLMIEKCRSMD